MSLSSLIVQREVASIRQVEEALARQVIYGGDLVTNLLEVASVDERVVTRLLAESVGLAPAPPGALRAPSEQARALVTAEMAAHREMVPLAIEEGRLVVAVAEPLSEEIEDELAFTLGMPLEQRIAPAVRVREALARVYGLPLERRLQRLLDRLADKAKSLPMPLVSGPPLVPVPPRLKSEPPRSGLVVGAGGALRRDSSPRERTATHSDFPPEPPPRPAGAVDSERRLVVADGSEPELTFPEPVDSSLEVTTLQEVEEPMRSVTVPALHVPDPRPSVRPSLLHRDVAPPVARQPARRRRGPLTLDMAKKELQSAQHRDALLDLFFDFGRQFFDYSALFVVHGDIAEGRDAWGAGASRERVLGIGVPLDLPSVFATARELRRAVTTRPLPDSLDAVLLGDLQRSGATAIMAVPIVVRTRVVALLLGDSGEGSADLPTSDVGAFATAVGYAFERLIMRRKLAGFAPGSASGDAGRVNPAATKGLSAKSPAAPPPSPALLAIPKARPMEPPAAKPVANGTATVASLVERPIELPMVVEEEAEVPADARMSSAPEIDATSLDDVSARLLLDELSRELGDDTDGVHETEPSSSEESLLAAQAAVAIPPHLPPSSHTFTAEKELPTVIVDIGRELGTLIERVLEHGADDAAEAELLRQGAAAMPAIMQRFPGPLAVGRGVTSEEGAPIRRASECGPLLRLVAAQRRVALPFVLTKSDSPDAETRYWATLLLTELAYPEALPSLVPRICDQEPRTRRAARHALRAVIKAAPREVVLEVLSKSLALESTARALVVIDALAEIREAATVPVLIHTLSGGDAKVSAAARNALTVITRQDFGFDARQWTGWWAQHSTRPRIEWLIESLGHELSEMRRAAGEELKSFAGDGFGYSEDLPVRERERVQQRYRDWWATEGRARYSRR
jgi:hypothetical protein